MEALLMNQQRILYLDLYLLHQLLKCDVRNLMNINNCILKPWIWLIRQIKKSLFLFGVHKRCFKFIFNKNALKISITVYYICVLLLRNTLYFPVSTPKRQKPLLGLLRWFHDIGTSVDRCQVSAVQKLAIRSACWRRSKTACFTEKNIVKTKKFTRVSVKFILHLSYRRHMKLYSEQLKTSVDVQQIIG